MIWLRLALSPPLQIGGGNDAEAARVDLAVELDRIELGGDRNANASPTIAGVDNALRRRLLAESPGVACQVYRNDTLLIAGTVDALSTQIALRSVTLELQT